MKENRILSNLGKVLLTFLIAISSMGMPTSVSAESKDPAYMYAEADKLTYINETGLSLEELKGIDVYEVISNMNIEETTWDELDKKNGEYVLRLRDHDPQDEIYPITQSRYNSKVFEDARIPSQRVYAFRVDPLSEYQACPTQAMYIELLGIEQIRLGGEPGMPGTSGKFQGSKFKGRVYATNGQVYVMTDPRIERTNMKIDVDLHLEFKDPSARDELRDYMGLERHLNLYAHYIDENGNMVKELLDKEYYELTLPTYEEMRATQYDDYLTATFDIKRNPNIEYGKLVAYEPVLEFESATYYATQRDGNNLRRDGRDVNISMTARYETYGAIEWFRPASQNGEKYKVDGLTLDEHIEKYKLEKVDGSQVSVECGIRGAAELKRDFKGLYGPTGVPGRVPKENEASLKKIAVGEVKATSYNNGEPIEFEDGARHFGIGGDYAYRANLNNVQDDRYTSFSQTKPWSDISTDDIPVKMQNVWFAKYDDAVLINIRDAEVEVYFNGIFNDTRNHKYPGNDKLLLIVEDHDGSLKVHESEGSEAEIDFQEYGYDWDNLLVGNTLNVINIEQKEIKVNKVWEGKELDKAEFILKADGVEVDRVVADKDNWEISFGHHPLYKLDESSVTLDNIANDKLKFNKINYTVEEVAIEGYEAKVVDNGDGSFTVTNKELTPQTPLTPAKTKVSVEKKWSLFQLKKQPVTINLLADGKKVDSVVLSKDNDWKHTFADLKVVNDVKDEKAIEYTVEEVAIDGFETIIEGNQKDGFIIINKEIVPQTPLVPATTSVSVEKNWKLFQKDKQPVKINLLADGEIVDTIELSNENDWKHTFTDLKVVNDVKDEKAIVYTVEEVAIDGFESIIEGNQKDGFIITNKEIIPQKPLIPATTSVSVTKKWSLFQLKKQPVIVNLLADGEVIDEVVLSKDNKWTHTFTDLKVVNDVTDEKAIVYSVKEVLVDGFESIIEGNAKDGFVITNKEIIPQKPLIPAKTSVSVEKNWKLFQKDKQPVTINLLADGVKVDTVELSDTNEWSHTFTDLKIVNDVKDKKAIVYTVEEVGIDGFKSIIEGNQNDGFVVTNEEIVPMFPLTPGKTSISVNKEWSLFKKDKQPVTINLLADGETIDSIELSDENEWSHTFTDLKVVNDVADEKAIVYTVEEVEIEGFESEVIQDGNTFTVINTEIVPQKPLIPAKTSVTIMKQWELMRLEKEPVVIELLADGDVIDSVELSDDNNWTHTFTDLNVVNDITDESAIEYTVREITPEGFLSIIEEIDGVVVITNSEIPVPNITADKTVDKAVIKPGEIVEYTITVTNDGTGNKFVKVKDPMDDLIDYITFVDEYAMVGDIPYTFSELRNGIEFEIGVGQTVEITFKVQFNEDAEGEFLNIAFVDELEPEVPVTVIPEEPNCDEPQDPNNPDPNCPIIPEEPNCDEPQDPNNPDPNCPIIPDEPQVDKPDVPKKPGKPVDTGFKPAANASAFAMIGLGLLYLLKKRK